MAAKQSVSDIEEVLESTCLCLSLSEGLRTPLSLSLSLSLNSFLRQEQYCSERKHSNLAWAMEATKRIRLVFEDDDILSEAQNFEGLNRSWLLLKPHQHDTVSDVASHLLHAFQLHDSCPNGLVLSLSGYVLPPFESTHILKDDEIIRVRKRRDILAIQGNHAANEVQKLKAVEKQPVHGDMLLLANEEFEKEKGGYESDEPEDEYEEVHEENLLEDVENPSDSKKRKRKRKRKAEEKLQGSKKKKQRSEATQDLPNDAQREDTENCLEDGEITKKKKKKKKRRSKEKTDDSSAEDNVENDEETAKSENIPVPNVKGNVEVQENGKETEEGKSNPEGTKKGPSRSARRKYAKRRWLREMAKIQKQNATCESEGLRNWKEDKSKAEREKVDRQSIRPKKWKKHYEDAEKTVDDGQPKGLLHWKQSPQNERPFKGKKRQQKYQNGYFQTHLNQNGDVEEQSNQKGDELEQTNQKQGDFHKQPGQQSAQENPNLNCSAVDQLNQENDEEIEVVPVVIRPGHIRFEPLGEEAEQAAQQNNLPSQTFQWNGITSKKKGQQWGKENRSFTPRNDYKNSNKENSEILSTEKEKKQNEGIDLEKLPPLPSIPKEGDLIAYRVLELSSSWTPELSPYRVGKVSSYDAESGQTFLEPVPEYPIVSEKGGEDADSQPNNSLYKEDGSLEINFSTLLDVRILNKGSSEPGNQALSCMTESSLGNGNPSEAVVPGTNEKEAAVSNSETGGVSIWDQVSEALNAKKEQLSKDNGWGKTPTKVQPPSQENSWGKNVKNVQPSRGSDWAEKVQPSQKNSWGKQNSGGKSWSYKALRGSALGPTMAIIRSKKDWS